MKNSLRCRPDWIWLTALGVVVACTDNSPGIPPEPPEVRLDAAPSPIDAAIPSDSSVALDSAVDSSTTTTPDVGAPLRPRVGINLTSAVPSQDAGTPSPGETLVEEIELLSLGIEATHLEAENSLAVGASAARFSARGVSVAVSLDVVRGRRSLFEGAPASWELEDFVTRLEAIYEEPLLAEYMSIGSALDVYLLEASKADRAAFTAFVTAAIRAAKNHPARPTGLRVGFNTRLQSWLEPSSQQDLRQWAEIADFVGVSWLPLDRDGRVLSQKAVAAELREFFETTTTLRTPLLLQSVVFPSSREVGSSPEGQAAFYDDFFDLIGKEVRRVPFVAVSALNDPQPPACALAAADLATRAPALFTEAWCSSGLRDRDLTPKPAYSSVIEGLARFSSR